MSEVPWAVASKQRIQSSLPRYSRAGDAKQLFCACGAPLALFAYYRSAPRVFL